MLDKGRVIRRSILCGLIFICAALLVTGVSLAAEKPLRFGNINLEQNFDDPRLREFLSLACAGNLSEARQLAASGISLSDPGKQDIPPIFWLVRNDCLDGARIALDAGVEVNRKIVDGVIPTWLAAKMSSTGMLSLLLDSGGKVNYSTLDKDLLTQAIYGSRSDNFRLLVERGADIHWRDSTDSTIGTLLVAVGSMDDVLFLLDHGYRLRLEELRRIVESRPLPQGAQREYKQKVLERLSQIQTAEKALTN